MNDPLFGNKVAAALLTVALLAVGLPVVVGTFAELGEHIGEHGEEHAAVDGCPEGIVFAPFDCSALGSNAEEDAGPEIPFVNVLAEADVERGERAAAICSSCHSFDKGGPNGTGPNLWDVIGRPVAGVGGYAYTSALQGLGGEWTYENMDPFLENSQAYVSGTAMAQKVRSDTKRADIIAYLGSLSDNPQPLPEPVAVEEETAEAADDGEAAGGQPADDQTAEGEVAETAADTMAFEPAQPGEAVNDDDSEVNNRGDDGMPGDPARTGSDYTSSNEDGADVEAEGFRDEGGLPNEDVAEESEQRSEPVAPSGASDEDQ